MKRTSGTATLRTSGSKLMDFLQADLAEDLKHYDHEDLRFKDDGTSGRQILRRTSGPRIMRTSGSKMMDPSASRL